MGIRRYSRDHDKERWERRFDALQEECRYFAESSPTIGDLLDHGIETFKWQCRNVGWKDDGKVACWHSSDARQLSRYGRFMRVWDIRCRNTCGACGRKRPFLELIAE